MRRLIGLMLAVVSAAACGNSTTGPSGPPFTQNLNGTSPATGGGLTTQTFTSDRRGVATVTLTWSNAATNLDFFATLQNCSTSPFDAACGSLNIAFSQQTTGTTETLTFGVIKDQPIKLWIEQLTGPTAQAFSIAVSIQ